MNACTVCKYITEERCQFALTTSDNWSGLFDN